MDRSEAGAIAKVGQDNPALGRFRPGCPSQLAHQERVRQAVKAVPPHPLRFVAARDRQQPGHARQVMVKRRVETRHLRQVWKAPVERLGQQDFLGQMFRIKGREPAQLLDHFLGD